MRDEGRVLVWFSCGAASAVAAKLAVEKYGDRAEVLYCDTLKYEHPDNPRFLDDVAAWIGRPIKLLRSEKYADIFDVFEKTRWLVGPAGARCTVELKKNVRKAYQTVDDIHVFGMTHDELDRIERFKAQNFELHTDFILAEEKLTKADCLRLVSEAGIELPAMYKLGYRNNNCIGCVKGQAGYWNKIRVDFPEAFARMAAMERKLDVAINKKYVDGKRVRVFLDELDPRSGRHTAEPDLECGVLCETPLTGASLTTKLSPTPTQVGAEMEITQVEVRRHRQRDGANDTIQLTALVESGENPLDVIDALDAIIKARLFTPPPKAAAIDVKAAIKAVAAEVEAEEQAAEPPAEVPVVEEGITTEAFNARVAAVGKRPGGAKCVITALNSFGVNKVGAVPVERRQEFLTAVNG